MINNGIEKMENKIEYNQIDSALELLKSRFPILRKLSESSTFLTIIGSVSGGVLSNLLGNYAPMSKVQRLEDFCLQLDKDFKRLSIKMEEFNDEILYIVEKTFRGALENYQKEKLDAFRGILINSLTRTDRKEEEKELYINLVNSLSVLHLRLLSIFANPDKSLNQRQLKFDSQSMWGDDFQTVLQKCLECDTEIIKSIITDLYNRGLINMSSMGGVTTDKGKDLLFGRLTELGKRFIEYCQASED